jgi:alpha-L-rhamnosidase
MNKHAPYTLKTEYLENPIGIDSMNPRFSWLLKHDKPNQIQTAFQLIVASSMQLAQTGTGDIWDSGKVKSKEFFQVEFKGKKLRSSTRYFWRVKWWDSDGKESEFSDIARFDTGLLDKGEWKAKWIGMKNPRTFKSHGTVLMNQDFGEYLNTHCIYLRKEFEIQRRIRKATAYICGLGFYELRINGKRVGNRVLEPSQTDYSKIALYSSYDVTYLLSRQNAIGVMLGNGRYIGKYGFGFPQLIMQILVEYENGEKQLIVSDESWKVLHGPLQENGIYYGEKYDARQEMPGWDMPGFNEKSWQKAVQVDGCNLASQVTHPIRVTHSIKPVSVTSPKPGVYIVDFGQNFTGWVRLKVRGPRGTSVKMRHAELIHVDGTLNESPNQGADATDIYILKGDGVEIYEPRFTYHGFRYVEVTGFPGVPSLENFGGMFVHSDVPETGDFICSNELINKIHKNCYWGQLSNLMSIPTDCPQRDERYGWLGDAHLAAEAAIYCFDMSAFYARYIRDIRLAMQPDGDLPDTVPRYLGRMYPADPAWSAAYMIMVWFMHQFYNDKRILEENYEYLKRYVEFLRVQSRNNIITDLGKYGDWCPPGSIAPKKTPVQLTSTFYYYSDTLHLSLIAKILGKKRDAGKYSRLAEKIKEAFNKEFLGADQYKAYKLAPVDTMVSQTSNAMPLFLDMVPANKKEKVIQKLVNHVARDQDCHLDTGILGTRYLLDVLTENGHADVAYKVATQRTYPGWGYMVEEGATTLWERWEKITSGGMNSHNHVMLASVDAWFYRVIGGISTIEPGWRKIRVKPYILGDLRFATASVNTIAGYIKCSWELGENSLEMHVNIPVGCSAEINVPVLSKNQSIKINGKIVYSKGFWKSKSTEFSLSKKNDKYITFTSGSGYLIINV